MEVCSWQKRRRLNQLLGSDNFFDASAQAAWRSGHSIRLRNERPGFELRQGIRY
jgi:hypothetical protein